MPKDDPLRPLRDALMQGVDGLTENQLKIVRSVVDALKVPIAFESGHHSDFVDATFAEMMSNFLVLHHALHEEALSKKPFEYVFKQCLIAQGHDAQLNITPGAYPYDVIGAGTKWSLKTEAAAGISVNQIKIEKLMEARWIRECVTPEACATDVREKLPRHLAGYDRIVVMRAFMRPEAVIYRLQEIPVRILVDLFENASPAEFSKTGKSPSFGANFTYPGHQGRTFRILLDSSVEKVRLWYQTSRAIDHGSWMIPRNQELTIKD
ncbi:hypothetical protein [Actinoplanes sp. NPDC049265]|uniref:hypothetical protein n=1 Tax=Actinoplanes sp. NPDC049265 TaxID=3363902 RepID=UPI0037107519